MSGSNKITLSDLDFYLTVIAMFCAYNQTQHFSDKMFADITSDIIKRDDILERLASDGYITAKQSRNFPHRYAIDITAKGKAFQRAGGYANLEKKRKNDARLSAFRKYRDKLIGAVIGSVATAIISYIISLFP